MMGICFIAFGIMKEMEDVTTIMIYASFLRMIQGASSAFV